MSYTHATQVGHHPPGVVINYLMWYWGGGSTSRGLLIAVAAVALAVIAVLTAGAGPLRRFFLSSRGVAVVATVGGAGGGGGWRGGRGGLRAAASWPARRHLRQRAWPRSATSALAAYAHGRPVVLSVHNGAVIDADGIVIQAERTGVRACLVDPYFWTFAVTSEFVCTQAEEAGGAEFAMNSATFRPPQGVPVIARLSRSVITPAVRA